MKPTTQGVQMNHQLKLHLSRLAVLLVLGGFGYNTLACTVVRYADDDGTVVDGPPPKVVDMLVMVDLDRGAANLTPDYGTILGAVAFGLAEQNVQIRRAAMAPLYTKADGAVPLVYGEGDETGEFGDFAEAIAFYTYDAGAEYLQDPVASDSANLATVGEELDTRSIYHPTTADPSAAAYFGEPADGFVVLYLSASPRHCAPDGAGCLVDGVSAVDYFTAKDERGASWLQLPGGGSVPVDKVFHGAIVTVEGADYATFHGQCSAYPNFPTAKLDVMQPSEQHSYFGPFIDGVKNKGGAGEFVDLCEAMSARGEPALLGMTAKIRAMF